MRHLISSLQNHNMQLKGDVQRFKRKLRETQMEINKVDKGILVRLSQKIVSGLLSVNTFSFLYEYKGGEFSFASCAARVVTRGS